MTWIGRFLTSSIGRKQTVAVTGLLLCIFLILHLLGNLLLVAGRAGFDEYALFLEEKPLLVIGGEIALAILFFAHIGLASRLAFENRLARQARYVVRNDRGAATTASRTMFLTGAIVLVFLVLHIANFKFGERPDGSLYLLVVGTFQDSVGWVVWYVFANAALGLHLSHGVQSAFRTLGLQHPKYTPWIRNLSLAFAIVIATGYIFLPVYCRWFVEPLAR